MLPLSVVSRSAICPSPPSGTRVQPNRQHAAPLHSPSPGRNLAPERFPPILRPLGWEQRRHHNEGGHRHASISFPSRLARLALQRLPCFQILHLVDKDTRPKLSAVLYEMRPTCDGV